ncbi:hypothetical protein VTL71DRAFT_13621 [Oculimacula yallundae]|uniref:Uncharacterized protein n=1 Tax=Oculimacula yallundae TaxID=86028 RepID=A0ABR4CKW4_9HELO
MRYLYLFILRTRNVLFTYLPNSLPCIARISIKGKKSNFEICYTPASHLLPVLGFTFYPNQVLLRDPYSASATMKFSILTTASLLLAVTASAVPSSLLSRQSSTTPIDTAPLLLGSCLAIGACYYEGNQRGCLTAGCGNLTLLGSICSCNADVQKELDVQKEKGQKLWPVKCPY